MSFAHRAMIVVGAVAVIVAGLVFVTLLAVENGGAKGFLQTALSAKLQRHVEFASYRARLLSGDPTVVFTGLKVASPPEISRENLLEAGTVSVRLRAAELWLGRVDLRSVAIDRGALRLVRLGPGRNNYIFGQGGSGGLLRHVESLAVTNSSWRMDDPDRRIFLAGPLSNDAGQGVRYPLAMHGEGRIAEQPVIVGLQGSALNGRTPNAAWPVEILIQDGRAALSLKGETRAPFDFSNFDFAAESQGPNLAALGWLLHTEAPNSPPYVLTVRARREDRAVRLTGLRAKIGNSDVVGDITSDHSQARRKISANLSFGTLRLSDLAIMASPAAPHDVARSEPGRKPPSGQIIGAGKPIPVASLRKLDTEVRLRADRLEGYAFPVRQLDLTLAIDNGLLDARRISFLIPSGDVTGRLTVNARDAAPTGAVTITVHTDRLSALRPQMQSKLDGDARVVIALSGAGASPKAMLADASGRVVFYGHGRMQPAAAAAIGGDDLRAVAAGAMGQAASEPVTCAVGEFRATHGMLTSDLLKIVTSAGYSIGVARIGLADGRLDIHLNGLPFRRFAAPSPPIVITGDLMHPQVSVSKSSVVAGAALSVLTAPLGALAPREDSAASQCNGVERDGARYMITR